MVLFGQKDVLLWMLSFSVVDATSIEFRLKSPVHVALENNILTLIEGSKFQILCFTQKSGHEYTPSWNKHAQQSFQTRALSLSTEDLNRSHAGHYTCSNEYMSRTLTLNVLYPPKRAEITAPFTVLRNTQVQVTCAADSDPSATYWWTTDPSADAPKIGTGPTFTINNVETDYILLYCFAQNKMVPTVGDTITHTPVSHLRHITVQDSAQIQDLPSEYGIYVGSTIDIVCPVDGNPSPIIWWTKQQDDNFYRTGRRLLEQDVKIDFAGVYRCHARNIISINGTDQRVSVSKSISVRIMVIDTPVKMWTVVAAVTGWAVAIVFAAMTVFVRFRKRKRSKSCRRDNDTSIELATVQNLGPNMDTSDSRRLVPNLAPKAMPIPGCKCSHLLHARVNGSASEETNRKVVGASNSNSDLTGLYELL